MTKKEILAVLENPHDYCDTIIAETIAEVIEIFKTCQIVRKPPYDCSCYMTWPNKNHRKDNGEWRCVDRYVPMRHNTKGADVGHMPCTKCIRKEHLDEYGGKRIERRQGDLI